MANQEGLPLETVAGGGNALKKLDPPPFVKRVCGISAALSAEQFFRLLTRARVGVLVDTRLSRSYQGARFADGNDLGYFCRTHNIEYVVVNDLSPTHDLRDDLARTFGDVKAAKERDPEAWTRFLEGYARLLVERKFLRVDGPTHRVLFGATCEAVAFLCACGHHDDCHRSVLLGFIETFVRGVRVEHLVPSLLDPTFKDPVHKSPRRYRHRVMPNTGLSVNAPTAARHELELWRAARKGATP